MTIQLTAPILIAGADQPIGKSLTLGADVEAELVNRGVAVYTSRTPTPGEGVVPLMTDESGIIIAIIANKVDAKANLRSYAGLDGQLSVASDADVIFRHTGVAGAAVPYYRNRQAIKSFLAVTGTNTDAVATTFTPLTLNDDNVAQSKLGPAVWSAGAPTEIVLPALPVGKSYAIQVGAFWNFAANATGAARRLRLEQYYLGGWQIIDMIGAATDLARNAALSGTDPLALYHVLSGLGFDAANRFRITAATDAGVAVAVSAIGMVTVDAFEVD